MPKPLPPVPPHDSTVYSVRELVRGSWFAPLAGSTGSEEKARRHLARVRAANPGRTYALVESRTVVTRRIVD